MPGFYFVKLALGWFEGDARETEISPRAWLLRGPFVAGAIVGGH